MFYFKYRQENKNVAKTEKFFLSIFLMNQKNRMNGSPVRESVK